MQSQTVTYFRFEQTTSGGLKFFAPVNFSDGSEFYFGLDASPNVIKYDIERYMDTQPDTFTVRIDKDFFRNPTRNPKYIGNNLNDPVNAFNPTTNHVIVIGDPPVIKPGTGVPPTPAGVYGRSDSYMFEDNLNISSPVFGVITKVVDNGANYVDIQCTSFLNVLDGVTLSSNFYMNTATSDVNSLQIYYEYDITGINASAPYFAPVDSNSYNYQVQRYKIKPVAQSSPLNIIPYFPQFKFDSKTFLGYETPKIAWRLLQEIGWCRLQYENEILEQFTSGGGVSFVNPQKTYTVSADAYNPNTMVTITPGVIRFSALDTDGLRYDYQYTSSGIDGKPKYAQTYLNSFDPSKQSILYNLKTLAETDGMYLTSTCSPRIETATGNDYPSIVWDRTVYDTGGQLYKNLTLWNIYAGFHPKVLIKRNPLFSFDPPSAVIEYGTFTSDPTQPGQSVALAKTIKWNSDPSDIINRILVKYGQASNSIDKYLEFPDDSYSGPFYMINWDGSVDQSGVAIIITLNYSALHSDTITGTYNVGTSAQDMASSLIFNYNTGGGTKHFILEQSGSSIKIQPNNDQNIANYWESLDTQLSILYISERWSATMGTMLSYTTEYIATEPTSFENARSSQLQYGKQAAKISLPEITTVKDAIAVCSYIFQKLSPIKYTCTVSCNNMGNGQLPLFKYFEIFDNSNTKQVINDKGASISLVFSSEFPPTASGQLTIMLPHYPAGNLQAFTHNIPAYVGIDNTIEAIMTSYITSGIYQPIISTFQTSDSLLINGIKFTYSTDQTFTTTALDNVSVSCTAHGISVKTNVTPYSALKQVKYDEKLPLLNYTVVSTDGTHTCTFGLPTDTLANVVNQAINWVGDVEKSV